MIGFRGPRFLVSERRAPSVLVDSRGATFPIPFRDDLRECPIPFDRRALAILAAALNIRDGHLKPDRWISPGGSMSVADLEATEIFPAFRCRFARRLVDGCVVLLDEVLGEADAIRREEIRAEEP